ncbi:MAG: glycosyltransferase family 9 protein [Candidatus Kapabacteria bacterium]|nr:glycosyltransferase family 9 protein [Candidatus Kapabacteria bacterium]
MEIIASPQDIFSKSDIKKVLLLRQDRLGDVIISLPLFEAFKANFPEKEFHICLGEKNIAATPFVQAFFQKIWYYEKNLFKIIPLILHLNAEHYDLIIDLLDSPSRTSSIMMKLIKSKYKLGFDKENRSVYTHIVPLPNQSQVHIVDRVMNILLPFNIAPANIDKKINLHINDNIINPIPKNNNKKRLGINLAGSTKAKFWGIDNYIGFINKFLENHPDFEIYVFVQKNLQDLQAEICNTTKAFPAPITDDLQLLAKMISTCDYFLTPDTATVHFASAFQIPTVVFYYVPEIPPKLLPWTPYKTPHKALLTTDSIESISVDDAIKAFEELMHK